MRLWHVDLIEVLPKKQLLSQWRECCRIARNIVVNGTPNHLLVNKILDYDISEFYSYATMVFAEMQKRGYKCDFEKFSKFCDCDTLVFHPFASWHNDRYFVQCVFNLQEKYDCGGITNGEWQKIEQKYCEKILCTDDVDNIC